VTPSNPILVRRESAATPPTAPPRPGLFGPMNPRLAQWRERTVWIVGASSGIGRATASALHAAGARVAVSARNAAALQAFCAEHPGSIALPLDVTDATAVQAATDALLAQTGRIDLLMFCAGHYRELRATEYDSADMHRHLAVNYVGGLNLLASCMPSMLQAAASGAPGHISLVGSVAGYRGLPKALGYGPTKAALASLTETLYLDLADRGIGVSLICPGYVDTPLTAQNEYTMPALITPEQAADHILAGWAAGDFEIHFPKRFTRWLKVARVLPYRLYFPLVRKLTGL
jgi:NAD(P)-dependent dehydrogenase (short-subunit alcohol dehydrogenase family)